MLTVLPPLPAVTVILSSFKVRVVAVSLTVICSKPVKVPKLLTSNAPPPVMESVSVPVPAVKSSLASQVKPLFKTNISFPLPVITEFCTSPILTVRSPVYTLLFSVRPFAPVKRDALTVKPDMPGVVMVILYVPPASARFTTSIPVTNAPIVAVPPEVKSILSVPLDAVIVSFASR